MPPTPLASDLLELLEGYEDALYAPHLCEIHFGCECGCGGDSYTSESWDAEVDSSNRAIFALRSFLEPLGVEWDLAEVGGLPEPSFPPALPNPILASDLLDLARSFRQAITDRSLPHDLFDSEEDRLESLAFGDEAEAELREKSALLGIEWDLTK